jgi:hypothetical protein
MRCNKTDIYITRGDTGFLGIKIDLDNSFLIKNVKFTVKVNPFGAELISKENSTGILETGTTLKYINKYPSLDDNTKDT